MSNFDIFLSFKNSDSQGYETKEKIMADELYTTLTNAGISVFYSNSTLPALGTAQYKAVIDDALDEAKILIAIGTSRENISSSWVRYEWDGFYSDILTGKKDGQLFSYIDDMSPIDLPRTLRQLQCFERKTCSLNYICQYVSNALGVNKDMSPISHSDIKHKAFNSTYSFLEEKEAARLKSQANLVCANDIQLLTPIIDQLAQSHKIKILDIGCADGYLTHSIFSNFKDKIDLVLGIDHEQKCLEDARKLYSVPFHFEQIEFESESFETEFDNLVNKYNVEKFDLVFCSLVLHHLSAPSKLLRKLRPFVNKGGKLYIRSCDDDEICCFPDNDNLLHNTLVSTYDLPNMSDRIHGRKLFSELYQSGYKDIEIKPYYITTSNMDVDEMCNFFFDIFFWRKNRFKSLLAKEPDNTEILKRYTDFCEAYDELEERFYDPSFYFKVAGPIAIATR